MMVVSKAMLESWYAVMQASAITMHTSHVNVHSVYTDAFQLQ